MSCSLNSLKGGYVGDYIWDYYRGTRGILRVYIMAHMCDPPGKQSAESGPLRSRSGASVGEIHAVGPASTH